MRHFGVEEEFMLVDPWRLKPMARAAAVREMIASHGVHKVQQEFLASQIEYASPVCADLGQAQQHLDGFREELGACARECEVVAAASGLPFDTGIKPALTPNARYAHIRTDIREICRDHQINAVHVHVEIGDRESGVRALNGLRPWLPLLLALGANSPFWRGADTGFASWRSVLLRRWSASGIPPRFHDADDYEHRTRQLVESGVILDLATIAWGARLSERYPTIEVRVFDAQLSTSDTVLMAALTRAVVASVLAAPRGAAAQSAGDGSPPELLDAALWLAARDGIGAEAFDPLLGAFVPAPAAVASLLRFAGDALGEDPGGGGVIQHLERVVLREGAGCDRQRAAYRRGGRPALAEVIGLSREPVERSIA